MFLKILFIDTETIKVYIKRSGDDGDGTEYKQIDNIIDIDKNSRVYFVREIDDQKYELRFGDGIFGKNSERNREMMVI